MKVLFISNIPTPYRNDFYNELGKNVDLTVIYEATGAKDQGIRFNWDRKQIKNYRAIFLSEGNIVENKIDKKIFKYITREYDYIIVSNYAYFTEMAAIIYLKLHRIPYIMEIDGGVLKDEKKIKYRLKRFLISKALLYFSPSKETDQFLIHYGADPLKIKRHPFTSLHENQIIESLISSEKKSDIRDELGIQDDKVIVGVGQLIHRKGWDTLFEIAQDIDAGIYILGDGELKKEYEDIIQKKKLSNVHLVGFMSNEKAANYYMAADIFVLPTRYDIWGLVVNEAMAYGLPVITTNACNAGLELVNNGINGYIIDPDNPVDLLSSINKAFHNQSSLGENSLKTIKKYTIENMAKVHVQIMKEISNA